MIDRLLTAFNILTSYFGDSRIVFIVFFGLAIGLLSLSVLFLASGYTNKSRRKVRALINEESVTDESRKERNAQKIQSAIAPFSIVVLPSSEKEVSAVNKRLTAAGHRFDGAITIYYVWKLVLGLSFGVAALFATTFFPLLTSFKIVMITATAAFVGLTIPSYILDKQVTERKRRIINAFPDMLDMLVACSEAGLGLNAALQRVSIEIEVSFPELASELEMVNSEMLAGVDRIQALRSLASRTDVSEISGFVSVLSQSVRFGTGIAETLRIYAEDFRDKRMQKAEEVAAKIGTKLLFPLILCMFPSFFLVGIGPAAITMMKVFSSQ